VYSGILSYPGRLSVSTDGKMLANSDSNHDRALVLDPDSGNIIYDVGSGAKGLYDCDLAGLVLSREGSVMAQPRQDLCRRQLKGCSGR
jgi:hypothetical protein